MPLAFVAATIVAVAFIGFAQGPINPASAHILSQRVPRAWFSLVFSVKQTGVPLGFAAAGVVLPLLLPALGWRGASLAAAGPVAGRRRRPRTVARPPRCLGRALRPVAGHLVLDPSM